MSAINRPFAAVAILLFALSLPALAADWKAGAAKEMITPAHSMWMAGYGSRTHPATGQLNDLYAKALVIEDADGERAAIITLDLVGISPDVAEPLTETLEQKYKLSRANVAICCSHTHSGPVVGRNLRTLHFDRLDDAQQRLVDDYAATLHEKVVAVVGRAIENLTPCALSYASGRATFAANRRNNPEADVPRLRAEGKLLGPFDHDVPVLKITDHDGELKAVLFGYACHATVLSGYAWSSDYPGFAQEAIEREHPDCVALFFAGCGADQNPLPRREVELARNYGQQLAESVETVLAGESKSLAPSLETSYVTVPLELADVPSLEQIDQEAASGDPYLSARAKFYQSELDAGRSLPQAYPYPIQIWRLGDELTLVALGGEVVVDYALRLKSEYGEESTWVAGYANDVMAYIPSRRVLTEGGYEGGGAMVYYALPSPWAPSVEEAIIRAIRGAW